MPDALRANHRILCSILNAVMGSAGAAEGATEGSGRMYESPCVYGMVQLMEQAYKGARVEPHHVQYIECHATGTAVGDLMEIEALAKVLGGSNRPSAIPPLRVASIKSNIGHAEVAAGLFSLIKVIEMLQRRVYLPTAGVTKPRSDFDWVANRMAIIQEEESFSETSKVPVVMGVSSFGIGGSYAHVVVEEFFPKPAKSPYHNSYQGPYVLPLSAASEQNLQLYAECLAAALGDQNLRDVCGTMAVHRSRLNQRKAFIPGSVGELRKELNLLAEGSVKGVSNPKPRGFQTLFVFTGQGSQWAGNGSSLLVWPAYAESVRMVDAFLQGAFRMVHP